MDEKATNETKAPGNIDISSLIPQITADVTAAIRERAINGFTYAVQQQVGEQVSAYIKEQIVPLIADELKANHAELRAAIVKGVYASVEALAEKLRTAAVAKITGYDGDKLIKEFIGQVFPRY
jgi:hypothetical protein